MKELTVKCYVETPVMMSERYIHLDSLLAAAIARRENLPPATTPEEVVPIEIPVKKHESGGYHLASATIYERKSVDAKNIYKRFPIKETQVFGEEDQRKVDRSRGDQKDYKIPKRVIWPEDGVFEFRVVGEPDQINELLVMTTHLGKKRSSGLGAIDEWEIEEGIRGSSPIVSDDGKPLRHLPIVQEQVKEGSVRKGRVTYPYWLSQDQQAIYIPDVG